MGSAVFKFKCELICCHGIIKLQDVDKILKSLRLAASSGDRTTDIKLRNTTKHGTVLIVWEHGAIPTIVRAPGVQNFKQRWGDEDYDSIWIISF
ncbi:MAG TPA: hypothetical protein VGG71_06930 [Chitinophagaceae bacterium]